MSEPASTTLAATTAVTTGAFTLAGSMYGVPADAMLAAVLGAAMAMSSSTKIAPTARSLLSACGVFCSALIVAVFFGPLVGLIADALTYKLIGVDLPDAPVRAAASLLVALGSQLWLPALLARVTTQIKGDA